MTDPDELTFLHERISELLARIEDLEAAVFDGYDPLARRVVDVPGPDTYEPAP